MLRTPGMREDGMTLMEVMVAAAIGLLALAMGGTLITQTFGTARKASDVSETQRQARSLINQLEADVRVMRAPHRDGRYIITPEHLKMAFSRTPVQSDGYTAEAGNFVTNLDVLDIKQASSNLLVFSLDAVPDGGVDAATAAEIRECVEWRVDANGVIRTVTDAVPAAAGASGCLGNVKLRERITSNQGTATFSYIMAGPPGAGSCPDPEVSNVPANDLERVLAIMVDITAQRSNSADLSQAVRNRRVVIPGHEHRDYMYALGCSA